MDFLSISGCLIIVGAAVVVALQKEALQKTSLNRSGNKAESVSGDAFEYTSLEEGLDSNPTSPTPNEDIHPNPGQDLTNGKNGRLAPTT